MIEKVWIYHCDKLRLENFVEDRDICEADVIEYLIDQHFDELEKVFPKVDEDPDNDRNIKADLAYERKQDERMGF